MELVMFLVLWFLFVGVSTYAIKYILSGGKSFLVGIPSIVLFIVIISMFPQIYLAYKGVYLWGLLWGSMIGIAVFAIALFK